MIPALQFGPEIEADGEPDAAVGAAVLPGVRLTVIRTPNRQFLIQQLDVTNRTTFNLPARRDRKPLLPQCFKVRSAHDGFP